MVLPLLAIYNTQLKRAKMFNRFIKKRSDEIDALQHELDVATQKLNQEKKNKKLTLRTDQEYMSAYINLYKVTSVSYAELCRQCWHFYTDELGYLSFNKQTISRNFHTLQVAREQLQKCTYNIKNKSTENKALKKQAWAQYKEAFCNFILSRGVSK